MRECAGDASDARPLSFVLPLIPTLLSYGGEGRFKALLQVRAINLDENGLVIDIPEPP